LLLLLFLSQLSCDTFRIDRIYIIIIRFLCQLLFFILFGFFHIFIRSLFFIS